MLATKINAIAHHIAAREFLNGRKYNFFQIIKAYVQMIPQDIDVITGATRGVYKLAELRTLTGYCRNVKTDK